MFKLPFVRRSKYDAAVKKIVALEAKLKIAQKNDHRDRKGRFTKGK